MSEKNTILSVSRSGFRAGVSGGSVLPCFLAKQNSYYERNWSSFGHSRLICSVRVRVVYLGEVGVLEELQGRRPVPPCRKEYYSAYQHMVADGCRYRPRRVSGEIYPIFSWKNTSPTVPDFLPFGAAAGRYSCDRQPVEAIPDAARGRKIFDCQHSRHHRRRRLFGFIGGQHQPRPVQGGTHCLSHLVVGRVWCVVWTVLPSYVAL